MCTFAADTTAERTAPSSPRTIRTLLPWLQRKAENDPRLMLTLQKLRQRSALNPESSCDPTCRAAQGRGQYRDNREGKTASFSCCAGLKTQPFQAWPGQELREERNAVIVRYAKDLWKRQKARKWEEKMRKKLREQEKERKKEMGHHNVKPGSFLCFKWVITGEKVSSSSTNTASSEILISVQTITSQPQLGGDHHC